METKEALTKIQEELTCSICKDYFKDPITIDCTHSFCQHCLLKSWDEASMLFSCPECQEVSQSRDFHINFHLGKLVFLAKQFRPHQLQNPEGQDNCEGCEESEEEETLLSKSEICSETEEHGTHTLSESEEAAKTCRERLRESQSHLWQALKEVCQLISKEKQKKTSSIRHINDWKEMVRFEYKRMHQYLHEEEQEHLKKLERVKIQSYQKVKENMIQMAEQSGRLMSMILELERKCQMPDAKLMQDVKDTLSRNISVLLQGLEPVMVVPELWQCRITGMREMLYTFQVDLILDAETANPYLIISEDLKSVANGGTLQNMPNSPERFSFNAVMAVQAFSSGKYYWEVNVNGQSEWAVGVCKESLNRRNNRQDSPQDIFLLSCHQEADAPHVLTCFPFSSQQVKMPVHQLGVFLDCNSQTLLFYDVLEGTIIFSSPSLCFSEPLRPIFLVGHPVQGTNAQSMTICFLDTNERGKCCCS